MRVYHLTDQGLQTDDEEAAYALPDEGETGQSCGPLADVGKDDWLSNVT